MKYKIIEVKDGNGDAVYELWYHKPVFWRKDRWVAEPNSYKGVIVPMRFMTKGEASRCAKRQQITRSVVEEGVVE